MTGYKQRRAKTPPENKEHRTLTLYIPQSIYQLLKALAEDKGLPMNRLICYGIDNELSKGDEAFDYPCEMPKNKYVEHAYTQEGGRILRFLQRVGALSIDQLMLSRIDIGVPDKNLLMLGIREILEKGTLVELVYPKWMTNFKFDKDYRVLAIKQTHDDRKEREIENLKRQLAKLQGETDATESRSNGPTGPQTPITEDAE